MALNFRAANLDELSVEADAIIVSVEQTFARLSAAQLNWKPAPKEWGVGQCFDHLTIVTASYLPLIRSILDGTKQSTFWEKIPGLPGLCANFLLGVVDPVNPTPAPAPPSWRPTESAVEAGIVGRFLQTHQEFTQLLRASAKLDVAMIVGSPSAAFITYSLLDAYRISLSHERLHMGQAQRVMQQAGFPGA
jgi:hypothetical protein